MKKKVKLFYISLRTATIRSGKLGPFSLPRRLATKG